MYTEENTIYGLALDIPSGSADWQTAKAFSDLRDGALELDDTAGDDRLFVLVADALGGSPALRQALSIPQSVFDRRVANSGAQACNSVSDGDTFSNGLDGSSSR